MEIYIRKDKRKTITEVELTREDIRDIFGGEKKIITDKVNYAYEYRVFRQENSSDE